MEALIISIVGALASLGAAFLARYAERSAIKKETEQAVTEVPLAAEQGFSVSMTPRLLGTPKEPLVELDTQIHVSGEAARLVPEEGLRLSTQDRDELTEIFRKELLREREELSKKMDQAGRRAFWLGWLQSAIFFALGVGVTLLTT
jgi:hypothetical protein